VTDLKDTARSLFLRTLAAIAPETAINRKLRVQDGTLIVGTDQVSLDDYSEVVIVGLGKASQKMGAAVERLLGNRIKRGILVANYRSKDTLRSEVIVAGHPLPDRNSLKAAERIIELVKSCDDRSLIVFLVSGGGSSLVELPISPSISVEDLRTTNQALISSGASIREINIVRKALSRIKGGQLGALARGSKCVALYISDVNPGDILSIASNPLLPEVWRADEFYAVVDEIHLLDMFPKSVTDEIDEGRVALRDSTSGCENVIALVVLDNLDAVRAAADFARQDGFRVEVDAEATEGDYRLIADRSIDRVVELKESFPDERVCLISGGEVSCPVRGHGVGGRNQEFVLYCATRLADSGIKRTAVLSCGTDGIDGNSTAAGAVGDSESVIGALRRGELPSSYINNNDSHSFFAKMGGLVVTGPTGNNVRDLRILVAD
jgi:glycerate 2-kinase